MALAREEGKEAVRSRQIWKHSEQATGFADQMWNEARRRVTADTGFGPELLGAELPWSTETGRAGAVKGGGGIGGTEGDL